MAWANRGSLGKGKSDKTAKSSDTKKSFKVRVNGLLRKDTR